jgi:hypothetical protein
MPRKDAAMSEQGQRFLDDCQPNYCSVSESAERLRAPRVEKRVASSRSDGFHALVWASPVIVIREETNSARSMVLSYTEAVLSPSRRAVGVDSIRFSVSLVCHSVKTPVLHEVKSVVCIRAINRILGIL